jgi:hypothetical protein
LRIILTVQALARFNVGFQGRRRMYLAFAGTFIVLSIGILVAHAMDAFRGVNARALPPCREGLAPRRFPPTSA